MDLEETMVEETVDSAEVDDTLPEGIIEETDESEEISESDLEEETEQSADDEQQTEEPKAKEPGYIKGRIEKAVAKAVAETEARMQAMFDRQMAPFREKMMEEEAQELVRSRKVADIETARELVRLRQGQPAQDKAEQPAQPRNSQGQFAPKEDPVTTARINMLAHQADRIKEARGIDVIGEFNKNPKIKEKVISGEMDFYDVAEVMSKAKAKKPPAPMRSPNGATGGTPLNAISQMTDEQFERLEKRIQGGARIRQR
jgi:hypothetical protein